MNISLRLTASITLYVRMKYWRHPINSNFMDMCFSTFSTFLGFSNYSHSIKYRLKKKLLENRQNCQYYKDSKVIFYFIFKIQEN